MPATFTTTLPDVGQPTLGNGVEDEIQVSWSDTINYGEYNIQYRETSAAAWLAGPTVSETVTSEPITGLEDGEAYEVRLRTQTEHVTGAWTAPATITTQFPGVTQLAVDATSTTSVTLSWQDNADNEDGMDIQRALYYPDRDEWGPWRTVAELDPNTESHTDATASPNREYRYRVFAYTEDTSAYSGVVSTTTDTTDARQRQVPAQGWHVEIDHPDTTTPRRPRILDDPTVDQTLNGQPRVQIPVPQDDSWRAEALTDAPMRVWRDGRRQPIEELRRVEDEPGRTVLVGVGGVALERGVDVQITQQAVDDAVRDVLDATGYAYAVDNPDGSTAAGVTLLSTAFNPFPDLIAEPVLDETEPIGVVGGDLAVLQSSYMATVGNGGLEGGYEVVSNFSDADPTYIDGEAAKIEGSGTIQSALRPSDVAYTIPGDRVGVAVRYWRFDGSGGANEVGLTLTVDDSAVELADVPSGNDEWVTYEPSGVPDVTPGSSVAIEYSISNNFTAVLDAIVLYDTKYPPTFDNPTSSLEPIDHPRPHQPITVTTIESAPSRSVAGGTLDVEISDTSGAQALGLSNDGGVDYETGANSAEYSTTFDALGASLTGQLTLDGYGARNQSPATGYLPQSVSSLEMRADLDDTPLILDEVRNDNALAILQSWADYTDSIFECRWDRDAGEIAVEWTQPGQRASQSATVVSDWSAAKTTEERPDVIRVEGSALEDSTRAQATLDSGLALPEDDVVAASERVTAVADGTRYTRDVDYTIDYSDGSVTPLSSGAIAADESLTVAYRYKPSFEASVGDPSPPTRQRTVQIAGLVTERGCGIAARRIASQLAVPLREAEVTLPADEDWSLVNALDVAGVPTDGPVKIRGINEDASAQQLRLATRGTVSEVFADVRRQIEAVARQS